MHIIVQFDAGNIYRIVRRMGGAPTTLCGPGAPYIPHTSLDPFLPRQQSVEAHLLAMQNSISTSRQGTTDSS